MKARHMKKESPTISRRGSRNLLLLLAAVLLLTTVTLGSLAYFTAQDSSTNTGITIGRVSCTVTNKGNNIYTITNTGTVDAYIRVAVDAEWSNDGSNDGSNDVVVYFEEPNYSVALSDGSTNNTLIKQGEFYYLKDVVAAGGEVTIKVTPVKETNGDYKFVANVVAEAIQGQTAAAEYAWGIDYSDMEVPAE